MNQLARPLNCVGRSEATGLKMLSVMNTKNPLPALKLPFATQLASQLLLCAKHKLTGRVDLQLVSGQQWSLYMSLGNLVWASGGVHPIRRWRRLVASYCPQAKANAIGLREADRFECWDYHILTILAQRQAVSDEQILAIVQALVAEVLFDIVQALDEQFASQQGLPTKLFEIQTQTGLRPSDTHTCILRRALTLELEPTLNRVRRSWEEWVRAGLSSLSPDRAPTIVRPQQLQRQLPEKVYKNLRTLADGRRSLRDLAVLMKRDMPGVARSLLPYIEGNLIELVELPDLERPENAARSPSPKTPSSRGTIACIDDSFQVCTQLETILRDAGYDCLTVQDPLQALPSLLQHKPELIFLDLTMPIINGYELCSQIRRIAQFQDTPIVILTGNDGIVDRVRAKIVGASDFVNKPVEPKKILATASKYIVRAVESEPMAMGNEKN
ncbi:MAG: response regulator [Cyanobacteriota bacterium]|nr:response regulator [Cyanobacteriota bacterium]